MDAGKHIPPHLLGVGNNNNNNINNNTAIGWRPIQGARHLSPLDSWDRLQQTPATQK